MDTNKYTHLRINRSVSQPLRLLSALLNETQLDIVERLVLQELARVKKELHVVIGEHDELQ